VSVRKNLVIVESPAKARTISKILGGNYSVAASMGHVRDLPENSLGVDISSGFAPRYQITKKKIISELKSLAKGADTVFLAPDPDREGEAIAWHLAETLKDAVKTDFKRVVFHEITKSAVMKAFDHPGRINMELVEAQQARRILDRIVGYKISEILWSKITKGLSAGRVQSVALRIICDREKEINAFVPKEFWDLTAEFKPPDCEWTFKGKLFAVDERKIEVKNADEAKSAADAVQNNRNSRIESVERKKKLKYSPPPFITSTLQQTAVQILRFSASQTMRTAQQLYEGIDISGEGPTGLITYMRTDSVSVAQEAIFACRKFIEKDMGAEFLPEKANFFKSKESAQEAHEAIRPTDVFKRPEDLKNVLSAEQFKLYSLIWKRFVASQMKPAEYDAVSVSVAVTGSDNKKYDFRTTASSLVFQGFLKVYGSPDKAEEEEEGESGNCRMEPSLLALLAPESELVLKEIKTEQKFTEPPPRFSEATLIKELESNGIGRPSTYASIVNTIISRKYTIRAKGRFVPTELGIKVNDFLVERLSELFQVGFTALMEKELDAVEEGKLKWEKMLSDFYSRFSLWVKDAKFAGAPENKDTRKLMLALDQVRKWDAPCKVGRRKYDDETFYLSVKKQFEEKNIISERQWKALALLAEKYKSQIKDYDAMGLSSGALGSGAVGQSGEIKVSTPEEIAKIANIVKDIIAILPPKNSDSKKGFGREKYSDLSFLESFMNRLARGIALSDKQMLVLKKIVVRHKDNIPNFDTVSSLIGISEEDMSKPTQSLTADVERTKELLSILGSFDEKRWYPRSGRKDDKQFFMSLSRQFEAKGGLSFKQLAALEKLTAKYLGNEKKNQ
jgi:DNA topoisomerase-1